MLLGSHYMYYYSNAYSMNEFLSSKGYIVLSVNYRSGIGYGLNFREATNYGAAGASEFNDVIGAGLYLKSRSDVDPKRIGGWGGECPPKGPEAYTTFPPTIVKQDSMAGMRASGTAK